MKNVDLCDDFHVYYREKPLEYISSLLNHVGETVSTSTSRVLQREAIGIHFITAEPRGGGECLLLPQDKVPVYHLLFLVRSFLCFLFYVSVNIKAF